MKSFFKKTVKFVKCWLTAVIKVWIIEPYQNRRNKRQEKQLVHNLKKQFKKDFGIDADEQRNFMLRLDAYCAKTYGKNVVKMTHDEHKEFLVNQLILNANEVNQVVPKPNFFYQPKINEIHNENIYGRVGLSFNQLKLNEREEDKIILATQELLPQKRI